jgi:hypothetical protein
MTPTPIESEPSREAEVSRQTGPCRTDLAHLARAGGSEGPFHRSPTGLSYDLAAEEPPGIGTTKSAKTAISVPGP